MRTLHRLDRLDCINKNDAIQSLVPSTACHLYAYNLANKVLYTRNRT